MPFRDGRPGAGEDFATGWLQGSSVRGRPVGLQVGADGALYLSADGPIRGRDLPDQLPAVARDAFELGISPVAADSFATSIRSGHRGGPPKRLF